MRALVQHLTKMSMLRCVDGAVFQSCRMLTSRSHSQLVRESFPYDIGVKVLLRLIIRFSQHIQHKNERRIAVLTYFLYIFKKQRAV